MICRCRNCQKKYDEGKASADWKGYCTQKCFHEKAKKHGYSVSQEKRLGREHSEYALLNRANEIGSVLYKEYNSNKGER